MKKGQKKRIWTKEQKLEIINKHLKEHVSVRSLEKEYNADRMVEFRTALRTFIEAIRKGEMDLEKIEELIASLEKLKKHKNFEKITVKLTAEELDVLVRRIYEYTLKLAKDNNVDSLKVKPQIMIVL